MPLERHKTLEWKVKNVPQYAKLKVEVHKVPSDFWSSTLFGHKMKISLSVADTQNVCILKQVLSLHGPNFIIAVDYPVITWWFLTLTDIEVDEIILTFLSKKPKISFVGSFCLSNYHFCLQAPIFDSSNHCIFCKKNCF